MLTTTGATAPVDAIYDCHATNTVSRFDHHFSFRKEGKLKLMLLIMMLQCFSSFFYKRYMLEKWFASTNANFPSTRRPFHVNISSLLPPQIFTAATGGPRMLNGYTAHPSGFFRRRKGVGAISLAQRPAVSPFPPLPHSAHSLPPPPSPFPPPSPNSPPISRHPRQGEGVLGGGREGEAENR